MKICDLICLAGAAYVGYKAYQWLQQKKASEAPKFVQPLPPGARPTGRVQQTDGAQPGGVESLGYRLREFAEVAYADGQREWRELTQ